VRTVPPPAAPLDAAQTITKAARVSLSSTRRATRRLGLGAVGAEAADAPLDDARLEAVFALSRLGADGVAAVRARNDAAIAL